MTQVNVLSHPLRLLLVNLGFGFLDLTTLLDILLLPFNLFSELMWLRAAKLLAQFIEHLLQVIEDRFVVDTARVTNLCHLNLLGLLL